jgi:hypothetical protein
MRECRKFDVLNLLVFIFKIATALDRSEQYYFTKVL